MGWVCFHWQSDGPRGPRPRSAALCLTDQRNDSLSVGDGVQSVCECVVQTTSVLTRQHTDPVMVWLFVLLCFLLLECAQSHMWFRFCHGCGCKRWHQENCWTRSPGGSHQTSSPTSSVGRVLPCIKHQTSSEYHDKSCATWLFFTPVNVKLQFTYLHWFPTTSKTFVLIPFPSGTWSLWAICSPTLVIKVNISNISTQELLVYSTFEWTLFNIKEKKTLTLINTQGCFKKKIRFSEWT